MTELKLPPAFERLKSQDCWVNFVPSKIPINPRTLHNASSTDSRTWTDFETASRNIGKMGKVKHGDGNRVEEEIKGVGLVLGKCSGLNGIDLDKIIDDAGNIDEDALRIAEHMDTYTELSPSGKGLHILFTGESPIASCKVRVDGKSRELYGERRYFTFTGDVFGHHDSIEERTEQAGEIYRRYFEPYKKDEKRTGSREKKNKSVLYGENQAAAAIRNHDAKFFRERLHREKKVFDNSDSFFRFLYSFPLSEFLGVGAGDFKCFFHEDTKPSASVFQTGKDKGGKWVYHCFAEDLNLNIKSLVEKLGEFQNEVDALEFLKDALNIEVVETEWSKRQNQTIDLILDRMVRTDDESFSALCPTADCNIRYGKSLYMDILILAKSTIFPRKNIESSDVLFYMSVDQITKAARRGSADKTRRWLKVLQYHGLLIAVSDEDIPNDLLQKARRTAKNGYHHVQFFRIPSMVVQRLEYIEQQGRRWKANRYTHAGVSYEMFSRCEGKAVADSLYPQRRPDSVGAISTIGTTANIRAEQRHQKIHDIALELLYGQGYFTERQVVEAFGEKYLGTIQAKRSLTDIANTYGLIRRKATKALKQRFSIESSGYPYIYTTGE